MTYLFLFTYCTNLIFYKSAFNKFSSYTNFFIYFIIFNRLSNFNYNCFYCLPIIFFDNLYNILISSFFFDYSYRNLFLEITVLYNHYLFFNYFYNYTKITFHFNFDKLSFDCYDYIFLLLYCFLIIYYYNFLLIKSFTLLFFYLNFYIINLV